MEGEFDDYLGYPPYGRSSSSNSCNGKTSKTVHSSNGTFELNAPRECDGSFGPILVKQVQKKLDKIEDKVISLYGLGMSSEDI